jgi:hypothetical protein
MATINNISFLTYGLYLSAYNGVADLLEGKEQFFTIYGKAGYQITKRRANVLELHAFIIADNLADFKSKTDALYTLFSSAGTKTVNIGNGDLETFAKEGFTINKVFIRGKVYAKFNIKLHVIA